MNKSNIRHLTRVFITHDPDGIPFKRRKYGIIVLTSSNQIFLCSNVESYDGMSLEDSKKCGYKYSYNLGYYFSSVNSNKIEVKLHDDQQYEQIVKNLEMQDFEWDYKTNIFSVPHSSVG